MAFSVDTGPRFNAKIADGDMARVFLVAHNMYDYPLFFDDFYINGAPKRFDFSLPRGTLFCKLLPLRHRLIPQR